MEKRYREFDEFDSPDPERSHRIEAEVEIVQAAQREQEEQQEEQQEGSERAVSRGLSERGKEGSKERGKEGGQEGSEGELTPEELAEQMAQEAQRRRESSIFWQFISGNWMILDGVTGTYRYLLIIAATLFLSVVSIFVTFHLSERLTQRTESVQLLRERSLEYQRIRFNNTSHSAIVKELERRGIPLYDLHESKTIIE